MLIPLRTLKGRLLFDKKFVYMYNINKFLNMKKYLVVRLMSLFLCVESFGISFLWKDDPKHMYLMYIISLISLVMFLVTFTKVWRYIILVSSRK
jgi:hypothetical protein